MTRRRVVVTGLGCISPVGNTVADAWSNLLAGQSGIAAITRFDASAIACRFAGEVKNFDLESYISTKEARTMDRFIHFGIAAATQAIQDAGLPTGEALSEEEACRIGVVIGSGIGGLPLIEDTHTEYTARGARRISPFFVPASIINMISGHVSMRSGFKGPNLAVVTACTTGLHSIGEAGRLIEYGDADVMIAGGSEACVSPLGVGGFAAMRALSTRNDDPTQRRHAGFGTTGDHHIRVAVFDQTTGFTNAVQTCGASGHNSQVRPFETTAHRHMPRDHVDDRGRDEKWGNPTRTACGVFGVGVFDQRQAANARTDHHTDAASLFFTQRLARRQA